MDGDGRYGLSEAVREAVRAEVGGLFSSLQQFVDRRIAELSSEVHATVQMVNFSESNIATRLEEMRSEEHTSELQSH